MSYFDAIVFGVLQGFTEYLPISSSAHLVILPHFLKIQDPGLTFDVFLHVGTMFSSIIYFWSFWKKLFRYQNIREEETKTLWSLLMIGTIPAVILGGLFYSWIRFYTRGAGVIAAALALGGVLLFAIDRWQSKQRGFKEIRIWDAFLIGTFQCLAFIPGVSRSGSTITTARFLKLDRKTAATFSFLLSVPVIAAAVVHELFHWRVLLQEHIALGPLLVGMFASFVSGYLAIAFLLKVLEKWSYFVFAFYRVLLAAFIVIYMSS